MATTHDAGGRQTAAAPAAPFRIHILGAAGSGTTTLGRALAARHDCPHHDADDFFWLPTDPPFQAKRAPDERRARLGAALDQSAAWVLSGSICGWGDGFIPRFTRVIFLEVPTDLRIRRLRAREAQRFGADRIAPGGALHDQHEAFIAWADAYDAGGLDIRSRRLHDAWLRLLPCPVHRLDGTVALAGLLEDVLRLSGSAPA